MIVLILFALIIDKSTAELQSPNTSAPNSSVYFKIKLPDRYLFGFLFIKYIYKHFKLLSILSLSNIQQSQNSVKQFGSLIFVNIQMGIQKSDSKKPPRANEKQVSFLNRMKQYLFLRNHTILSTLKLTFSQVIPLMIIEQLQKLAIITRMKTNSTLSASSEMLYVSSGAQWIIFDIFEKNSPYNLLLTCALLFLQILIVLAVLLPIKSEQINEFSSKYVITFLQMLIMLPSFYISSCFVIGNQNVIPNIFLFAFSLFNILLSQTMQLQCSFQREDENLLVRTARPITSKVIALIVIALFPAVQYMFPKISLVLYSFSMLMIDIYNWIFYLYNFVYFHELLMYTKGIMLTISISANVCYLTIFLLDNAIISQNILLFIATFSIFLGNFFITIRQHTLKETVINKQLKGENQIGLYSVFYWHCYTKITEKKNQLYVSSLLKKHMNQCEDLECCCKHRADLYDTYLKSFGNPNIQPHFDKIFMRHFIRKLLNDGYERFNKSSILVFLLCSYNIEIVQMITQTIQLIKKLHKMQQRNQLSFTQQFLLYCLKMKISDRIVSINFKNGNLDLESVKLFDEELIVLNDHLKNSIKTYHSLWKRLQQPRLNEQALYHICKDNLELMFSIQKAYKTLKNINNESTELKTIMHFYAKLILHDIHLLSEVKKDLKNDRDRNRKMATNQINGIQLFGSNSATMISLQTSKIKWSSKGMYKLFQYSKDQFQYLTVKNLMPKYFAERHDHYIDRWKVTGHHIKLNKSTYLWGNTKSGTLFSFMMFAKVIPLLHEQDYGFFSSIEKMDDQFEVVCSEYGQIYGAGRLFCKSINISPKALQEIRPNIQVFVPLAFDYFLQYFYPKNSKLKTAKSSFEVKREGYFPQDLQSVMRQLQSQRSIFFSKQQRNNYFAKEYLGLIRSQMQQLSCNINGQYISLAIAPFRVSNFVREKQKVIALKVSNIKRDNLDKYYDELQKTISKLQDLAEEDKKRGSKSIMRRNRSDFFKVFLNPKRVKRILEREQEGQNIEKDETMKRQFSKQATMRMRDTQKMVAHRRQLAQGHRIQLKNDRVRYNLFKIKKILLEQGVISRYTFNLLMGKQAGGFTTEANLTKAENQTKTIRQIQEDQAVSDYQNNSIDNDSDRQIVANKDNDNQTFNSASSSATFISMTNHVKLFKLKLRSLNTPRPLLFLNLFVFAVIVGNILFLIYSASSNTYNLNVGINEFQNNRDANVMVDSLLIGQMNIININNLPNDKNYIFQRDYFMEQVSGLFQQQMYLRAIYKAIDPQILGYLTIRIVDNQTLTVRQFIQFILNQIVDNDFRHVMKFFTQAQTAIENNSKTNIFFQRIKDFVFYSFIVNLVISISLFVITLPIVYKIKIKIKQIYDLLSKIGSNDKIRYFQHFRALYEEFKNKEEIQYSALSNIMSAYENKAKYSKTNPKIIQSEQIIQNDTEIIKQQSSISTDRRIYIKILGIYLVLFTAITFNYVFVIHYHTIMMEANGIFINLINAKTKLTCSIVEFQFELMGYRDQSYLQTQVVEFVDVLYLTYNMTSVSEAYKEKLLNFVSKNPCYSISREITPDMVNECYLVNNKIFSQGAIDNIYYTLRKLEQRLKEYYESRNNTPNDESRISYPTYFLSDEYKEISFGYFLSTLMIYQHYEAVRQQLSVYSTNYQSKIYLSLAICLASTIVFVLLWLLLYLSLAESASYINAFLLLIPFQVLSQNPYIKLYIKNEFDYKANY